MCIYIYIYMCIYIYTHTYVSPNNDLLSKLICIYIYITNTQPTNDGNHNN